MPHFLMVLLSQICTLYDVRSFDMLIQLFKFFSLRIILIQKLNKLIKTCLQLFDKVCHGLVVWATSQKSQECPLITAPHFILSLEVSGSSLSGFVCRVGTCGLEILDRKQQI